MSKTAKFVEIREKEKEIAKIAERAAKYLEAEHNITISHSAAIPTITYVMMREAINYLNETKVPGSDVEINFLQLFDIGISHRENDEVEKEGNFTPYLRPGQEFKLLVKDDNETEA